MHGCLGILLWTMNNCHCVSTDTHMSLLHNRESSPNSDFHPDTTLYYVSPSHCVKRD